VRYNIGTPLGLEGVLDDIPVSLTSLDYRRAMGLFATGVAVLAVYEPDGRVTGMTANAITSVSLDPLLLLVCVDKMANIASAIINAGGFSLSFLSDQQEALSDYFAGRGVDPAPAFSFEDWSGGPLLAGCIAAIGCRRYAVVEGGDHWIVEGEVIALHHPEPSNEPLMFFASEYQRLIRE
jgi:flavin reductase (DIM6/NTAB) family NADH-FMN oxidoreductase RutF